MKPALFFAVTMLLLPWSAFAQVPSIVEGSDQEAGARSWRRVLRNQGKSSLAATWWAATPSAA